MKARTALSTLVLLGLAATASLNAFRQEVTLAYRWTKGEPVLYRVTQDVVTTMSGVPGMGELTVNQTMSQVLRTVPDTVAQDGTATLSQSVDSIRMAMSTPAGNMGYDSADPAALQDPSGMMKNMFSAMLGVPFTVVLAPTGRVEKVDGMSRIMEKVFQTLPQNPGSAAALEAVKGSLSDEAMRGLLGQGFAQFPGKPVRVGDTWNGDLKTSNPMLGGLATSTVFTLNAIEGSGDAQLAKVGIKLSMKQEQPSSAQNPFGLTVQMTEALGQGELSFNVAKGRLVRSSVDIDMPFSMTGNGPDGAPLSMTSKAKSKTTVEAIEK